MKSQVRPRIVVVGQIGRDLVLGLDELPSEGGAGGVRHRRELLGGKGANQAVACAQLGADAALIGVVGDDAAADLVLDQARADGIDVGAVIRRRGARTALLVDVIAPPGTRRLLEHVEESVLLTREAVRSADRLLRSADAVLLQLQQPAEAILAALEATASDTLLVADGAPDEQVLEALLKAGAVLRANARETVALAGRAIHGVGEAVVAARGLVDRGARAVMVAAGEDGDVLAWPGGHVVTPLLGKQPLDPTGAGDVSVAAVTVALLSGESPECAAWWSAAATAQTVAHEGGRPRLEATELRSRAAAAQAAESQGRA